MNKRKIFIIIIVILAAVVIIYQFFIKKEKPSFILEEARRGTVIQEVSETGTVKMSEKIELGFKNSGRIENVYVKVGDKVKNGQALVSLDTNQLSIQLNEAQANLGVVKAEKTNVQNQVYNNAFSNLSDSYSKLYAAYNIVYEIQQRYFYNYQGQAGDFINNKDIIKSSVNQAKIYLDEAKSYQEEKIDSALTNFEKLISKTKDALNNIIDIVRSSGYRDLISSTDKSSLDNQRTYISTAYSNIINSQQEISTTKATQESQESLYQAKVNQAQAQILLLQSQIQDAVLRSPTGGQITEINKKEGETTQSTDSVISFLPSGPFQIEVNIYEEDIVKTKVGDSADITLAAFPDRVIKGEVTSINPAEKIIDDIVYYKVTINFKDNLEGVKPGMTADIVIQVGLKENVLSIPREAVRKIGDKTIVEVFRDGLIEEREVKIGLRGYDKVEILAGLEEREKVIIR